MRDVVLIACILMSLYADCVRNAPCVQQFAADKGLPLLIVHVGDRPTWKDPSHPLRNDTRLPVTTVPTAATWVPPGKPAAVVGSALEAARTPSDVHTLLDDLLRTSNNS